MCSINKSVPFYAINYENTVEGDGYKYRGRGLVHLTWKKNYRKATEYFSIDFVSNPEAAAEFKNSIPIMIWGMKEGIFSGAKIGAYISNSGKDYIGARMVINGVDDKELIAGYAEKFEEILKATSKRRRRINHENECFNIHTYIVWRCEYLRS